jgi:hypothetical protein
MGIRPKLVTLLSVLGLTMATGLEDMPAYDYIGPGPRFEESDEKPSISPDGSIEVRQYVKPGNDDVFQFWTFDRNHQHPHLLNPGETGLMAEYGAGFRFSTDSHWLVRMQKIAAGESTLFLYHRQGFQFVPATPKALGDMAWDYFFSRPDAKGIDGSNLSPETDLVKGMDDNYAWMGEHWPDSRYIVISLGSGESHTVELGPWRCVYDMKTGKFSVPSDIDAFNQKQKAGN